MTFYWKVRKDFLDYIEDSMPHDSLIGSTISTRPRKSVSCASKISVEMPSLLRTDPEVYDDKKAEALKKVSLKSCD
jgi:hypothetical protein